jgi:hypothetical protein
VTCLNVACGEKDGVLPLYEANLTGNDSLLPIKDNAHIQTTKIHTVKVKKLNSILELQNIVIDMLWVDVQGYELSVLKGAKNILYNVQSMFLEINESAYIGATVSNQLEDFLNDNGFYNAHQETYGPKENGSAFFLNKKIKTNFFKNRKNLEKRIDRSLEERRKIIILTKNFLYHWFSILLPTSLKVHIKKILHI